MELAPALARIGVEVAQQKAGREEVTIYLRVDNAQAEKWIDFVTTFLRGAHGKKYKVDLSKYFYLSQGDVRYLWRVFIRGATFADGIDLLRQCAVETSLAHAPQLDSFPLVGRIKYPFDPARGKLKGGHDLGEAELALGQALGAGVAGSAS